MMMRRTFFLLALSFGTALLMPRHAAAQWSIVNTGGTGVYQEVAVMDADHIVIASDNNSYGETVTSTDGGLSWVNTLQTFQGFTDVAYAGSSTFYVLGRGSMVKSTDGGASWMPSFFPWNEARDAHFYSPDRGAIAQLGSPNGNYGGLNLTTDGGANWDTIPDPGGPYPYAHHVVWFFDSLNGVVSGTENLWFPTGSFIGRTTDGGHTWSRTLGTWMTFPKDIFFPDTQIGYVAGSYKILKTTDSGYNWTSTGADTTNFYESVYFADASTGFACGRDLNSTPKIWKTTNGGNSWAAETIPAGLGMKNLYSIRCANENECWCVGDSGLVLHLADSVTAVMPPAQTEIAMRVYPNPAEVIVTVDMQNISEAGEWEMVNASGQAVAQWNRETGIAETQIHLGNLPSGLYLLHWRGQTTRATERILVR